MKFVKPTVKQKTELEDASYWYHHSWFPIREVYFSRLRSGLMYIPDKKQRILDIGVGSGILLPSLARNGSDVYGIDYRKDFIKKARDFCEGMGVKAKLHLSDAAKLPFHDNFFDSVISMSVMEHVPNLENALMEVKRILKPNGIFVVGLPIEKLLVKTFFYLFGCTEDVKGFHVNDYVQVRQLLKKHFKVVKTRKLPSKLVPDTFSIYLVIACINKK